MGGHKHIDNFEVCVSVVARPRARHKRQEVALVYTGGTLLPAAEEPKIKDVAPVLLASFEAGHPGVAPVSPIRPTVEKTLPDGTKVAIPARHTVCRDRSNKVFQYIHVAPLPPKETVYVSRMERDTRGLPRARVWAQADVAQQSADRAARHRARKSEV